MQKYEAKGKFYLSICLEMHNEDSFQDDLTNIMITNIKNDPLPLSTTRCFLVMTLFGL